jgi:rhodanese-related sulfurtransferase
MLINISALKAFDILSKQETSELVDVRTLAEWSFVGVPDLSSIKKQVNFISIYNFPNMEVNENFEEDLINKISQKQTSIIFICRSGSRSKTAAELAVNLGYDKAYNVIDGFEGDLDKNYHRNNLGGWKFSRLPWKQN